jgi:hypothetical protein
MRGRSFTPLAGPGHVPALAPGPVLASSPVTSQASSPPPSSQVPELMPSEVEGEGEGEGEPNSSSPEMLSDPGAAGGGLQLPVLHGQEDADVLRALALDEIGIGIGIGMDEEQYAAALEAALASEMGMVNPTRALESLERSPSVDLDQYVNFASPLGPPMPMLEPGIQLSKTTGNGRTIAIVGGSPSPAARRTRKVSSSHVVSLGGTSNSTSSVNTSSIFPLFPSLPRLSTPPPYNSSNSLRKGMSMGPSTPPPHGSTSSFGFSDIDSLGLSPQRTPLSHMGLHMSPNASLAHFKTHLDPPALGAGASGASGSGLGSGFSSDINADFMGMGFKSMFGLSPTGGPGAMEISDLLRTPSRSSRKPVSSSSGRRKPLSTATSYSTSTSAATGVGTGSAEKAGSSSTSMFPPLAPVTPKRLFPSLGDVGAGAGVGAAGSGAAGAAGSSNIFSFLEGSPFRTPTKRASPLGTKAGTGAGEGGDGASGSAAALAVGGSLAGLAGLGLGTGFTPYAGMGMHDPGDVEDELSRLGSSYVGYGGYGGGYGGYGAESPAGLLGKEQRGMLYESPSAPSPGTMTRFWQMGA